MPPRFLLATSVEVTSNWIWSKQPKREASRPPLGRPGISAVRRPPSRGRSRCVPDVGDVGSFLKHVGKDREAFTCVTFHPMVGIDFPCVSLHVGANPILG